MKKILICVRLGADGDRARVLADALAGQGSFLDIAIVTTGPGVALSLLDRRPDAIIATGFAPEDIVPLASLRCPCIWDMAPVTAEQVTAWLEDEAVRPMLQCALAAARGFADIRKDVALLIEDAFALGITPHSAQAALGAVAKRIIVILGAGLGNMIYGISMVRWLSEAYRTPVDLVIHDRFDEGVTLFAGAQWLNVVYPGFEYLAGRDYDLLVSSVTAGGMRPPFTAKRSLWVDHEHSYNEEGRFLHELRLNFLGLEDLWPSDPNLLPELPYPFIRDFTYSHPGNKVIGIASGKKSAVWAKREWQHMPELVTELNTRGWDVRSFGLPAEYVEGARDVTGLPMRQMLEEMAQCAYFVSYDGGMCHIAEAMGIPTVWLFGSTGTVKNGPVFAHGRNVLSRRACGPCLYKIDWIRNSDAQCMEDIQLSDVVATLEAVKADITANGYVPALAKPDPALLVYEVEALQRPGPPTQWAHYHHERTAIFPQSDVFYKRHVLSLMSVGDFTGAMANCESLLIAYPDDVLARFLSAALRQVYTGQTPLSGLLGKPPAEPDPLEMTALVAALVKLNSNIEERHYVLQTGYRYWMQRGDVSGAVAFVAAAADSISFSQGLIRSIQRYVERLAPLTQSTDGWFGTLNTEFEKNPSLKRMRAVLAGPIDARIDGYALALGTPLGLTAEEVREQGFVPHLAALKPALPSPIRLDLGAVQIDTHHHAPIVLLVPHVMVKNALPGTSSNLIMQHATRLAMIGLRPVVITVGFDDIPDGWAMRDSVTYLQAHMGWSQADWAKVLALYGDAPCLSYGDVDRTLALPADVSSRVTHVALNGLFDTIGLYYDFTVGNRWSVRCDVRPLTGAVTVDADLLSDMLFVKPEVRRESRTGPLKAVVLLNDARDFQALVTLVTATPSVDYTVITALVHRGIEKNLRCAPPNDDAAKLIADAGLLIQFSTRPASLCAEAVSWVERGGRLIAASNLVVGSRMGGWLTRVGTPANPYAWVEALQAVAASQAEDASVYVY